MAKRHIDAAYLQICNQYSTMLSEIRELQEEASKGMMAPEILESYEKTMQPIKNSKATWDYFMYLLNMPNRKEKLKGYHKAHVDKIRQFEYRATLDRTLKENEEVLEEMRRIKNSLCEQ